MKNKLNQIITDSKIQEKRNNAAHASTSGERREFMKEDIDIMIKDLKDILITLYIIAEEIEVIKYS